MKSGKPAPYHPQHTSRPDRGAVVCFAHQRVQELKSFYSHLAVYIIGNLGMFLINILTTPDVLWFLWPLLGWGIGLALHAFWLFAGDWFFGKDWEEREIRKILENEKQS